MNKIQKYFKDYDELKKAKEEFNREHWCGNLILCAAIWGAQIGVFYLTTHKDEIKEKIEKKKASRKEKREMESKD